jgi:iron complex transport system permease protein
MRRVAAVAVLLGAPLALAAALWFGSVDLPAREWLDAIAGSGSETSREIVWGLRAPRALAAFAVGALLAVAGTLLQVLLRNPLADPTILGVSGGAAVGAMVGLLLAWPGWAVQAAALAGACAAAGSLLALALRLTGWNIHRVLLTGVAIGAACGAIVSLLLALAPPGRLHGMLFWLLGDLSGAEHPLAPWVAAVVVVAASQVLAPRLDALALGTLKARSLGVAVGATQTVAFLAATVATVAAVLVAGSIGFVGLVVPHALRLAGFGDHRHLVPLAALAGGALLTAADTLARSVVAPLEFPVGAITALVGVPVLLALLARSR